MSDSIVRSRIFSSACSLSGNFKQVPVGVGHEHVLRLPADPAAHVDVAVRRAGSVGVDVQAHAGVARLAHAAAAARDVERHRAEVARFDELDPRPDSITSPVISWPRIRPAGRGRAPAHHVLVGAADVRRDDPEDRPVRHLAAHVRRVDARPVLQLERREVDVLDLDRRRGRCTRRPRLSAMCPLLVTALRAPAGMSPGCPGAGSARSPAIALARGHRVAEPARRMRPGA